MNLNQQFSLTNTVEKEENRCTLCGHIAIELKCKIICMNCGAKRDCSDP